MKRRGFLGLMGGAVAAGPAMAKQAVASMAELSLPHGLAAGAGSIANVTGQLAGYGGYPMGADKPWSPAAEAAGIAKQIADLMARKDHDERAAKQYINGLDPDLAVNRSMALHAKMTIQKRREYWRSLESEKSWMQRRIDELLAQVAA